MFFFQFSFFQIFRKLIERQKPIWKSYHREHCFRIHFEVKKSAKFSQSISNHTTHLHQSLNKENTFNLIIKYMLNLHISAYVRNEDWEFFLCEKNFSSFKCENRPAQFFHKILMNTFFYLVGWNSIWFCLFRHENQLQKTGKHSICSTSAIGAF